ncbi:hypothetical protein [Fusibacter sp. JL216-2]|uniref:hypothetical protein n=1 Tax=Fusibacter sp. JL216-2 TaxID=3071453 RepID=UPI003D33B143
MSGFLVVAVGLVGSFASTIALAIELRKNNRGKLQWILLVFLIISMIMTSYSQYQLDEYRVVENEATKLIKKWPTKDRLDYVSSDELRGHAIAGFSFIERHRDYFPESFNLLSTYVHDDMALTKVIVGEPSYEEIDRIQGVFITIAEIVGSMSDTKYK